MVVMAVILPPTWFLPPVAGMPVLVDLLPPVVHADPMKKVAVVVQDGAEPFGLGSMCEVWGEPYHPEDDNPVFDFLVATPRPGRVQGATGYDLHVDHSLDDAADADLVCLVPKRGYREPVAGGRRAGARRARPRRRWSSATARPRS